MTIPNIDINSINILHGKERDERKHDQLLNICVHMSSSFPVVVTKYPGKSNIKEKFCLAQNSITVGEVNMAKTWGIFSHYFHSQEQRAMN